jgi:hypothetical protein
MAYIGKSPVIGNFVKLDAITAVNGQAAYTMQNGGSNFTDYESVNQFLVSLNGTIQAPTDSFTVSGSTLTFASNLSTGDVIDFIMVFGNSLSAGTPTDATVTTAKLADSAVTAAKITDATITSAKLASGVVQNQSAFKNLFINGDMTIAQRGTTSSSTGYQTVDRWQLNTGTQQEQKTDTPDARFSNSFEVTGTTGGSSGYGICSQRIESKNVLQALGQTCTLSAYVKNTGTSTVNVSCEVYRANSTDTFSGLTLLTSLTSQAITTGWTRITFPSFTVTDACSTGLEVRIFRYDASNDQEWLITGVQLEVGSAASDFEFLPVDVNLRRCQRYYYGFGNSDHAIGAAQSTGSNTSILQFQFPTTMRTTPSVTKSGTLLIDDFYTNSGSAGTVNSINSAGINSISIHFNAGTGTFVAPRPLHAPNNSGSNIIQFNSEL